MENTSLIALSRQAALRRQMDVVANNLANMNTGGYKAEKMMFIDQVARSRGGDSALGEKLTYTRDIATYRDMTEGPLQETGSPLDIAIRGEGMLVIDTPDGERYSRGGRLQLNDGGQLVTQQGYAVMSEGGQPFQFTPNDKQITISRDGTVSTENGDLGRLRVVSTENPYDLQMTFGGLFTTDAPIDDVTNADVVQGVIEGSNVESVVELTRMIKVSRGHASISKFIEKEDERQRRMVRELLER